ncbi:hypothetical protein DVB69_07650 [Sporosarcina sp. BI001-red]|uniref:hypothetical protein n=1 Tax=Sporosarcina sp. BI001-red TaxID=2282866 RepID=UPI000E257085|nr:hypothetical protein [Sporosarcina sp. BI001-red]REB07854.1 hypothetical protein DVB69_07650 [Sporosarcina sp. BI001-red]
MRAVVNYVSKGVFKSKYILLFLIAIILISSALLLTNLRYSGNTFTELQEINDNRKESLDFLISKTLNKKNHIGLPDEQQQALDSLLAQEDLINEIDQDLHDGNLTIAADLIGYIDEYENYTKLHFVNFENESLLKIEKDKAQMLVMHNLPYTEQQNPVYSVLFTKQLLQLFLNPITAMLFLLFFTYKHISDEQNRTFDFFRVNSVSNRAIYFGYLISFLLFMASYIVIVSILSVLPPLLTGNLDTIHYPTEVIVGAETKMVPVWKWLLFIPIGWGVFVSLLLTVAVCLCKQRISLGLLLTSIALPVLITYIISAQAGFHMANPIHLVLSYEAPLLTGYQFVPYLAGMLGLLLVVLCVSYPLLRTKRPILKIRITTGNRKQYQPKMKWKMLQFEKLKKRRSGQFLFLVFLLFGVFVGTVIMVNQQNEKLPEKALRAITDLQSFYIDRQVDFKLLAEEFEQNRQSEQSDVSTEEETAANPYTEIVEEMMKKASILENLKKQANSPQFVEAYRKTMKSIDDYQSYKELEQTLWSVTVMATEEQQVLLEKKGLSPWPIGDVWVSNLDDPKTAALDSQHYKTLVEKQEGNTKYGNSALFTSYRFFTWNVPWLVLGVFVLFLWTSMAEEKKPVPSVQFLSTQPLRLRSVYISKTIYNLAMAYVLLFVAGVLVFLFNSLLGGIGDAQYPIVTYATAAAAESSKETLFYSPVDLTYFSFDGLGSLLVKCLVLVLAQLFFLNGLFGLLGRWMNHPYAAILTTLFLTIAGVVAASQFPAHDLMVFNPFLYFDTWNIADGWKSVEANSASVNVLTGCLVLVIGGFALFLLGLLSPGKKVS